MNRSLTLFASCPKGIEGQLLQELKSLGAEQARETVAGVSFEGSLEVAYRCCLWSRLANRILYRLSQFTVDTGDQLYQGVAAIDWSEHLTHNQTLRVDCRGEAKEINNTHFGALKVKDAIVDQIREKSGQRPSIERNQPDIRVNVLLSKGQGTISIDLSGVSLHQRGYRKEAGAAPLKENLAAAILNRAGWSAMSSGGHLVDPMCGAGTLLIEAALIAADIAPGLDRDYFGFIGWLGHDTALWDTMVTEAGNRRKTGLANCNVDIQGYEADADVIRRAQANIQRAGLKDFIKVSHAELATLKQSEPTHNSGLLITNPPYGERLGEEASLIYLYQYLGRVMKEQFVGWRGAVLTGNPELGKRMGIRARKQYRYFNGTLPTRLLMFEVAEEWFVDASRRDTPQNADSQAPVAALTPGAQMFANRLRKNRRQLAKWVKQQDLQCYRLYDADMPEYAVAIDIYGDWVCVQEYQAPKSVDVNRAAERLRELMSAIPQALEIDSNKIVFKERQRQTGKQQYQRRDTAGQQFEVKEHGCRLLINLKDYLDTGLFLDHRPMRRRIASEAKGKSFLNLFCYTAAVTVHAAKGGATSSVSVDLSPTYLEWARKNLSLNGFSDRHQLVQADCMEWIRNNQQQFDLIFIDPPTFSNSKRMEGVFDVQEDHSELIENAMRVLAPGGVLYFSNNFRRFKLDASLPEHFVIEDISRQTLDRDFARNGKIHRCWKITRSQPNIWSS